MLKQWVAGACLALAALAAHADPQSSYQWMLKKQIFSSTQVQNGQAVATIGPLFYTGDFASQQNLCGILLSLFQQQDASVQQFTLVDPQSGRTVGTYSAGTLTLSSN